MEGCKLCLQTPPLLSMQKIYLMMNKPAGYVCSSVSDSHKTVYSLLSDDLQALVKDAKRGERLHTVGRLDCDTSGLLLLTNDGFFSSRLARPEYHCEKTYRAVLRDFVPLIAEDGGISQECYVRRFEQGLKLPAEKKAPEQNVCGAKLCFLSDNECEVTVSEGKFHQVKRMFLAVGNEVVSLHRLSVAGLLLDKNLAAGQYRPLTPQEMNELR